MFTPFAFVKNQPVVTGGGGSYPLTTAYLAATGITGSTNITALQNLETDLNTYSLTSKIVALYPMIGGTIDYVKYNFMNPVDTDAGYRLIQSGSTPTVNMFGVAGDGGDYPYPAVQINPSFNTNLPLVNIDPYSNHFCTYVVDNPGAVNVAYPAESGVHPNSPNGTYTTMQMNCYFYGNNLCSADNPSGAQATAGFSAGSDSKGFFVASRTSATNLMMYRQRSGKTTAFNTNNIGTVDWTGQSDPQYLTITTAGRAGSTRRQAFYCTGTGLTESQADDLYTAVQAYQTTLGRNI